MKFGKLVKVLKVAYKVVNSLEKAGIVHIKGYDSASQVAEIVMGHVVDEFNLVK